MTVLQALWLPVIVSAVIVFVASSLIHMMSPWHKGDLPALPNEAQVSEALRPFAIPPGDYMVPRPATRDAMKTPEFAARMIQGPNFLITVLPNGLWSMGRNLGMWFVYCLVVSFFAALASAIARPAGFDHRAVFHLTALTAFIAYSLALWQFSIWYRRAWSSTIKATVDAIIYALLTAATFVWLWPR